MGISLSQLTVNNTLGKSNAWKLLAESFGGWAKVLAICLIVELTNPGALKRILLQLDAPNYPALVVHIVVWLFAAFALWAVAFEASRFWRAFGALLIGLSTAVAWGFRKISQIELSVFDGLALWDARHEAPNAALEYSGTLLLAVILFVIVTTVMFVPARSPAPAVVHGSSTKWLGRAAPLLTVGLIAAVMFAKSGGAYIGMPRQFSQLSIASLVAYKEITQPMPEHGPVVWSPTGERKLDKIVMLVDESIRGDFVDPNPQGDMPGFAGAMSSFVNYGAAASGGVCSNYSNTIMRYAAARTDLGAEFGANPTLFQFAKKAGFRTVYVDAQARMIGNLNGLQNFMSKAETEYIDTFYPIRQQGASDADFELGRILAEELAKPGPVFIYANKEGAHIPFDQNYPPAEARFHPTMAEAGHSSWEGRIGSYRNAIAHNVDKFFAAVWPTLNTRDAGIIYTSDHAQFLSPNGLTHCLSAGPNQRMALVPLYAFADKPELKAALQSGAMAARGRASHFMIAPTLLSWMGYSAQDIGSKYHESLEQGTPYPPAFTTGDIFGLFNNAPIWNEIELGQDFRSTEKGADAADSRELAPAEQPWLQDRPVLPLQVGLRTNIL